MGHVGRGQGIGQRRHGRPLEQGFVQHYSLVLVCHAFADLWGQSGWKRTQRWRPRGAVRRVDGKTTKLEAGQALESRS